MEERLDILNEKGEKISEATYTDAHHYGLLHRSVEVWFVNSKGQLLLQKRTKNKVAYPGHWDISASGHVSAGQSSLEAAQMETQEELGVFFPLSDFKFLFTLEEHIILNEGTFVNNEFSDVYLVHSDLALSEFKLASDEVESIRWIDKKELEKWIKGKGELLVPHEEEYKKLLEYLSQKS